MKRKFSMFLNIAMLCLCVCAIAFGVYSAKQASLNVSGTVGFTAHNCKVKVDSSLSGFSETLDGEVVSTARTSTKIVEGTATLDLGTFYFTDLTASGNTNDITLLLTFTNQSDFKVDVTIEAKDLSGSNITVTSDKTSLTLAEQTAAEGKTGTAKVTLKCTSTTKIDSAKFEILSVSMAKHTEQQATGLTVQSGAINGLTGVRNYVTMGTYNDEAIKWYIFAQGNGTNMTAVSTNLVNNNAALPAGTYWFISEYVLGTSAFGSNNTYEGSTIQTYLEGDGESSFTGTYGIVKATDSVYRQITGRTINDAADEANNVGAVTTANPQKLWLLSYDEVNLLTETKVANDISSQATASWWLRSPRAGNAFGVFGNGIVSYGTVDYGRGVRAAFQA